MEPQEIADKAQSLVGYLMRLRDVLVRMRDQDAPLARSRHFSPLSMDLGPLSQWIYVIGTHLQAQPPVSAANPSQSEIGAYARYLDYLIAQIDSDERFVSEMNFNWSKHWLQHGSGLWEQTKVTAHTIKSLAPREQLVEMLRGALTVSYSMRPPKD